MPTPILIIRWAGIIPILVALLILGACDKPVVPRSLATLSDAERREKFEDDLNLVRRYDDGLRQTLLYAKGRPDLFVKSEEIQLTPRQKSELRAIWQTVLDYMRALDGIKGYWRDFHKFGVLQERRAHVEAFTAGYAAWLTQYRHGLEFVDLSVPSAAMEKLLDERSRSHEIPAGSFGLLKWNVINVKAVTRLMGSHQYWKTLLPALADYDCAQSGACSWAQTTIETHHDSSKALLKARGAVDFGYNAFDIARDMSFDAWFPLQAGVALWMGDTKIRRLHEHLVSPEQLAVMLPLLQPGDVIVARHNWYLSNVGLPGFWPHAELYLGSPTELAAFFDDAEVKGYFEATHGVPDLPTFLRQTHPDVYKEYETPLDDHPRRVMEAISEGVVLNSLERAAGADYVGVMRPRQTKLDKALAVVRAFELYGLPYDFNFDFTTDDTLVCTELVYKSWRASKSRGGLGLDTANVMGRVTLPANDIVRQFDVTCDDDDAPLEFVYFIDGREKQKTAVVGTKDEFRKSWERPKWDPLQQ